MTPQLASSRPAPAPRQASTQLSTTSCKQHAGAAGAQGDAHGDFALPRFGTREQKVGDVGAGDQQHEGDGAEQDQQRLVNIAEEFVIQRGDFDGAALRWSAG